MPGNHDIPCRFPARFTRPWREFEREWETTEPVYAGAAVHVVGVNSVRPWHHQSGGVADAPLERAASGSRRQRPARSGSSSSTTS